MIKNKFNKKESSQTVHSEINTIMFFFFLRTEMNSRARPWLCNWM